MSYPSRKDFLPFLPNLNVMSQPVRLACLVLGAGFGSWSMAQSDKPLQITRAVFDPASGVVTVTGKLDCSSAGFKHHFDIIATVEQMPAQAGDRDGLLGSSGIGSAVAGDCRQGQARQWSVSVGTIGQSAFSPGAKAHFVVSSSQRGNDDGDLRVISTEADLLL